MSRRNNKRRPSQRTAVIEQDRPQEQRRQPQIKPGGQNFQPISDKVIQAMYQHLGPQANTDTMFAPGAPIKPVPGITPPPGPRVFQYPVGYNIAQLPRSTELYSFGDLRSIASIYYGIQLSQQVWFDYISKLELVIEPRPDLIDEDEDVSQYQDDIQKYLDFFAYPDKEHDLHEWLCMAVKDQLEIDALSIFIRKDRIGRPYALDIIDGAMIKPLVDDRGRRPAPPWPAFEQFYFGLPSELLTSDNLIYVKETQRSDSVYGRSRVEKMMLYINLALRKQTKDLAHFTDGTLPQGFLKPSMDVTWSQEEMEAYEIQLNNYLAGNDELRARLKMLPRGFEVEVTDDPDIHIDLDTWILNVAAAFHGLTMDELAMTDTSNRSVGQSQENVVYRRAMGPLMGRYARLLTSILRKYFKENRFVCKFAGYGEHEDFNMQATAYGVLVTNGIQSPTQAARAMNLPIYNDMEIPPFVMTKTGPMMLEDLANPELRQAQMDAQLAGLAMAKNNPGAKPGDTGNEEEGDNTDTQDASKSDDKTQDKPGQKKPVTRTVLSQSLEQARKHELKQWCDIALARIRKGTNAFYPFTSEVLKPEELVDISYALQRCKTTDEVKGVFARVRNDVESQHTALVSQGVA